MGPSLPRLPTLQSCTTYCHSCRKLHTFSSPIPTHPHRPGWTTASLGRISILPYCHRPFYTRWPEVIPISDITAETVARALLSGWISHFGCPQTITTDQGRQFESQIFHCLANICGIHISRTTPHHPAANGLVERLHRTMKAAIMCHANEQWTDTLPLVLLGIRTAYKEDLQSSTAELVYGEPLRIPGELLVAATQQVEPSTFIHQLRQHMNRLRSTPASHHASPGTFVHKDLAKCTHVFLRQDGVGRSLQPPYSGPHQVAARTDKTFTTVVRGRHTTVSTDRVKPAYFIQDALPDVSCPSRQPNVSPSTSNTPSTLHPIINLPSSADQPLDKPKTTRSGRTVHFPARFLT